MAATAAGAGAAAARFSGARIILASASPRRVEILAKVDIAAEVLPSRFPEDLDKSKFTPAEYVAENARCKAMDVLARVAAAPAAAAAAAVPTVIIAADSVVVADGAILEKPRDAADARRMMTLLSGRRHQVLSAATVATTFVESTEVDMIPLSPAMIDAYVATTDPYDKAGGYGIQARAAEFVAGIHGDYYNVMGLPICRLAAALRALLPP